MEPYFWWTDEQKEFYVKLGEFFKTIEQREAVTRVKREHPFELYEEVGKSGIMGAAIPKEYGGLGLGATGSCMLAENVHFVSPGMGRILVGNMNGGLRQIVEHGTEEQKAKFLPSIANGTTGAVVITEVTAGTDASGISLRAVKEGDHYVFNGRKRFIVGAGVATNYFIYARTTDDPELIKKHKHLTAFMVDAAEIEGIVTEKINDILGFENCQNGSLIFNNCVIPESRRVGEEGQGFKIMMNGLNFERTNIAATSLGWHRTMLRYATSWAQRRVQFGKPVMDISENQFKISKMVTNFKLMRDAVYVTAKKWDNGENVVIDASAIKAACAGLALQNAEMATQIMAGDGINTFYPVKNLFEIAKTDHIAGGTVEACNLTIFRQALKFWAEDLKMPRRVIDPETGTPVPTYDPVEKVACTEENLLNVLAENYRVNQGLCMTIEDIAEYIDGSDEEIIAAINALEASGDAAVAVRNRKTGAPTLTRASYDGLSKAHPDEYYMYWQSFIDKDPRRHLGSPALGK